MRVKDAILYTQEKLSQILKKDQAEWETLLIISHLLKIKPLDVYLFYEKEVDESKLNAIINKRLKKAPLAYILKEAYFWGRKFFVEEGVLIPRQETELIIEVAKARIKKKNLKILELGIGSGVIGITLLLELNTKILFGIDISEKAIEISKKNARSYKVESRCYFVKGDWFKPLAEKKVFDLVVTNPPYIPLEEWKYLEEEVRCFEPKEALVGGEDGLYFHKITIKNAWKFLKKDGFLIFEMGYNQAKSVKELLKVNNWQFEVFKDLLGYERVVIAWQKNM